MPDTDARAAWLEARRSSLGASEVAAILGVDPYRTSTHGIWAAKVHGIQEQGDRERFWWGHQLEDLIAARYQEVTGRLVIDPGEYDLRPHPFSCLHASLDRETHRDGSKDPDLVPLELKSVGADVKWRWKDGPPVEVQVQLQAQLAVTGASWGSVAAFFGDLSFDWWDLERHQKLIDVMLRQIDSWWERHVVGQEPPPIDGSRTCREALHALYSDHGTAVRLQGDADLLLADRDAALAMIKRGQKMRDEAENHLKARLQNNAYGQTPENRVISWREQTRNGYTVEPSTMRVFRTIKALPPSITIDDVDWDVQFGGDDDEG